MVALTMTARTTGNTIRVKAGDAESLLSAIAEANRLNADSARAEWLYILIPDGLYNLGDRVLTTLTAHHVALIGQSMEGTVIQNKPAPENEGISKTATLRLTGSNTYIQDLTLKNALDYYAAKNAGRAVCLQDKGTFTICKRVRMLSHQDTYYSDNVLGQMYFDEAEIHGTVDFICGPADVYFNRCTIVTEARNLDGSGRNVIAAPRTENTSWGYVFESCTVYNNESDFQWARGWKASPRCVWLNTTLMNPERLKSPRFDQNGLRAVPTNFKEYHTMDADGRDITPETNVVKFNSSEQGERSLETIMKADEACRYKLEKIFPSWRPEKIVERMEQQVQLLKQQAW
jgi:hypothetical protein